MRPVHPSSRRHGSPGFWGLIKTAVAELRAIPWFHGALRDALLTLGAALAMMGIDAPGANWALWWPLILLGLATVMTWHELEDEVPLHWRHLGLAMAGFLLIGWRGLASLAGPMPAEGLRELQGAALIMFCAAAFWLLGHLQPLRALGLFAISLAISALSLAVIRARTLDYAPGLQATVASLAGCALIGWSAKRAAPAGQPPAQPGGGARGFWKPSLLCLALGAAWGALCLLGQRRLPLEQAIALDAGRALTGTLWTQSILFGWGPREIAGMVKVLGQPRDPAAPPWTGFNGLLAQWGVLGLVLFAAAFLRTLRARRRLQAALRPGAAPAALGAFFAFLAMCGWWAWSGPRAQLPLLLLACWCGLGFSVPIARRRRRQASLFQFLTVSAPALALAVPGIVCAALLFFPTLGNSVFRHANAAGNGEIYRESLSLAGALNPFDPRIPLAMANSLRRDMGSAEGWSEAAYIRVLAYYAEAEKRAPYETIIPMRQAQFQMACDRQEEALKTMQLALVRQPNARELLAWVFMAALRNEDLGMAQQALGRGLQLEPESLLWRQWQYELARRAGQSSAAADAARLLLTAEPGNPGVFNAVLALSPGSPLPELPD